MYVLEKTLLSCETCVLSNQLFIIEEQVRSRRGCDHMVASWIWIYLCNQCLSPQTLWSSNSVNGEVYPIQHYVIQFVSDLRQVGGFSGTPVSFTIKTDLHNITAILLKVALNTITLTLILYQHNSICTPQINKRVLSKYKHKCRQVQARLKLCSFLARLQKSIM
jgi:hypothetical protein